MPAEVQRLEARLEAYEQRTGIHVDVVTIETNGGANLVDYSGRVFHQRSQEMYRRENTALLFLLIINDRKVSFNIGYGLRPRLDNAFCEQVANQYITPEFQRQQYGRGVDKTLTAIFTQIGK
jgi:uncharacterized protein